MAEDVISFGSSLHSGLYFLERVVRDDWGKDVFWGLGGFGVGGVGVLGELITLQRRGGRDCGSAFYTYIWRISRTNFMTLF